MVRKETEKIITRTSDLANLKESRRVVQKYFNRRGKKKKKVKRFVANKREETKEFVKKILERVIQKKK